MCKYKKTNTNKKQSHVGQCNLNFITIYGAKYSRVDQVKTCGRQPFFFFRWEPPTKRREVTSTFQVLESYLIYVIIRFQKMSIPATLHVFLKCLKVISNLLNRPFSWYLKFINAIITLAGWILSKYYDILTSVLHPELRKKVIFHMMGN